MDVRQLSREFGGKLCFNGGVDVQGTMVHGSPATGKKEVRKFVRLFGRFNGGYIGGMSHGTMPETPLDGGRVDSCSTQDEDLVGQLQNMDRSDTW